MSDVSGSPNIFLSGECHVRTHRDSVVTLDDVNSKAQRKRCDAQCRANIFVWGYILGVPRSVRFGRMAQKITPF
jgi:hypothetical protein